MITNKEPMQYRKSRQREKILALLMQTDTHPTADWIYVQLRDEIPGLSLGTVYRNLGILVKQGVVCKLPFGSSFDRYEAKIAPHYHLVCDRCGSVRDAAMSLYDEINRRVQNDSTFKVLRHRIDIFGICEECQNKST